MLLLGKSCVRLRQLGCEDNGGHLDLVVDPFPIAASTPCWAVARPEREPEREQVLWPEVELEPWPELDCEEDVVPHGAVSAVPLTPRAIVSVSVCLLTWLWYPP